MTNEEKAILKGAGMLQAAGIIESLLFEYLDKTPSGRDVPNALRNACDRVRGQAAFLRLQAKRNDRARITT